MLLVVGVSVIGMLVAEVRRFGAIRGWSGVAWRGVALRGQNVCRLYFNDHFPKAIETARQLRAAGGEERFM